MIPISYDMYLSTEWRLWLIENIGPADFDTFEWYTVTSTSDHYVDLYIEDPEMATFFRLKFGV